ncbi:unnamed protein product, partial [marine sediment metagenome]
EKGEKIYTFPEHNWEDFLNHILVETRRKKN